MTKEETIDALTDELRTCTGGRWCNHCLDIRKQRDRLLGRKEYHATFMTAKEAEAHTRFAYNVPDDCGLGWTPYRVLVTQAAIPCTAFHTREEFRSWIRSQGLRIAWVRSCNRARRSIGLVERRGVQTPDRKGRTFIHGEEE